MDRERQGAAVEEIEDRRVPQHQRVVAEEDLVVGLELRDRRRDAGGRRREKRVERRGKAVRDPAHADPVIQEGHVVVGRLFAAEGDPLPDPRIEIVRPGLEVRAMNVEGFRRDDAALGIDRRQVRQFREGDVGDNGAGGRQSRERTLERGGDGLVQIFDDEVPDNAKPEAL